MDFEENIGVPFILGEVIEATFKNLYFVPFNVHLDKVGIAAVLQKGVKRETRYFFLSGTVLVLLHTA